MAKALKWSKQDLVLLTEHYPLDRKANGLIWENELTVGVASGNGLNNQQKQKTDACKGPHDLRDLVGYMENISYGVISNNFNRQKIKGEPRIKPSAL